MSKGSGLKRRSVHEVCRSNGHMSRVQIVLSAWPLYSLSQKASERGGRRVPGGPRSNCGTVCNQCRRGRKTSLVRNEDYLFHAELFMPWPCRAINDSHLHYSTPWSNSVVNISMLTSMGLYSHKGFQWDCSLYIIICSKWEVGENEYSWALN